MGNQLQLPVHLSGLHLKASERQCVSLNSTTKYSLRVSLQRLTCPNLTNKKFKKPTFFFIIQVSTVTNTRWLDPSSKKSAVLSCNTMGVSNMSDLPFDPYNEQPWFINKEMS